MNERKADANESFEICQASLDPLIKEYDKKPKRRILRIVKSTFSHTRQAKNALRAQITDKHIKQQLKLKNHR